MLSARTTACKQPEIQFVQEWCMLSETIMQRVPCEPEKPEPEKPLAPGIVCMCSQSMCSQSN